ncbi:hypothetical protein AVEN_199410-1 [Araneus ventricosus]|uniref:Uncharacterized protein n=1 Tax=Araneus ventricosus TaxID=182803 RepID=A0A4Y2KCF9_ARAVE|nr:hypothetical protein AVEN_199410-1 [Araneus ventricosus]
MDRFSHREEESEVSLRSLINYRSAAYRGHSNYRPQRNHNMTPYWFSSENCVESFLLQTITRRHYCIERNATEMPPCCVAGLILAAAGQFDILFIIIRSFFLELDTLCRIKTCGYSSLVNVFDCFPIQDSWR